LGSASARRVGALRQQRIQWHDDAAGSLRRHEGAAVADEQRGALTDVAVRTGIATGLVVVGDLIGAGAAQEQAVVGETPNLAARLQAVGRTGDRGDRAEHAVVDRRAIRLQGPFRGYADLDRSGAPLGRHLRTNGLTANPYMLIWKQGFLMNSLSRRRFFGSIAAAAAAVSAPTILTNRAYAGAPTPEVAVPAERQLWHLRADNLGGREHFARFFNNGDTRVKGPSDIFVTHRVRQSGEGQGLDPG
jgi:hypothetical protein